MKSLRCVGEWVHMPTRCSQASWASDLTWKWALRMICDILTYMPKSEWERKLLLFVFPCGPAVNCRLVQDVTLPPTEVGIGHSNLPHDPHCRRKQVIGNGWMDNRIPVLTFIYLSVNVVFITSSSSRCNYGGNEICADGSAINVPNNRLPSSAVNCFPATWHTFIWLLRPICCSRRMQRIFCKHRLTPAHWFPTSSAAESRWFGLGVGEGAAKAHSIKIEIFVITLSRMRVSLSSSLSASSIFSFLSTVTNVRCA